MKKPKDPKIYLGHILESIERIEVNTSGVTKKVFAHDLNLQDIVMRRVEIIGEAVRNLPMEFRKQYGEIPWRDIAGSRDKLIHQYFDVNIDLVWEIVKKDIPRLKRQITSILKQLIATQNSVKRDKR